MGVDPPQLYSVTPSPDDLDTSNGLRFCFAITLFDCFRYNIQMYLKMAAYANVYIDLIASKAHAITTMYNKIMFDLSFKNQLLLLQIVLKLPIQSSMSGSNSNSVFKTLCAQINTRS